MPQPDAPAVPASPARAAGPPQQRGAYPFHHPVAARFADLDPLGHVNNVALTSWYEDARVAMLRQGMPRDGTPLAVPMALVEITVRYFLEVRYPSTVSVGVGVRRIGRTSVQLDSALFLGDRCAGTASSALVHVHDGVPRPLPVGVREALLGVLVGDAAG